MSKGARAALFVAAAACVAVAAGAIAYGAIPGATSTISGCYEKHTGLLRVVDAEAGKSCTQFELPISWNQKGAEGDQGVPGPDRGCRSGGSRRCAGAARPPGAARPGRPAGAGRSGLGGRGAAAGPKPQVVDRLGRRERGAPRRGRGHVGQAHRQRGLLLGRGGVRRTDRHDVAGPAGDPHCPCRCRAFGAADGERPVDVHRLRCFGESSTVSYQLWDYCSGGLLFPLSPIYEATVTDLVTELPVSISIVTVADPGQHSYKLGIRRTAGAGPAR